MGPDNVRTKASRGVAFLSLGSIASHGISFVRLMIVVRWLAPVEFGHFALASVLYGGLQSMTALGIDRYLIQKGQITSGLVRSAWGLSIVRGTVMGCLIWVSAPFYASFLGIDALRPLLSVVAFAAVVSALSNPGRVLAERELNFRRIAAYDVIGAVAEAVLLVGLAYWLRSAEALAWGLLGGAMVRVALSFAFFEMVGWPRAQASEFRELIGVGARLLFVSVGAFVTTQADDLVAGAVLGAAATGIYAVTYRLASTPTQLLLSITNRASLPALSRLQSDRPQLDRSFSRLVALQLSALAPMVALLAVFAPDVIGLVYGAAWLEGVPVLRALALLMVGRGLTHVAVPYLFAAGRFTTIARSKLVELLVFAPAVYAGARFGGLEGLALAVGASYVVGAGCLMSAVRIRGFSWPREIAIAALCTGPAILAGTLTGMMLPAPGPSRTILLIVAFGGVYAATMLLFRRQLVDDLRRLATDAFPSLTGAAPAGDSPQS